MGKHRRSPSSIEMSTARGRGQRWKRWVRSKILERDGNICALCPEPFTEEDPPTIEHVIPVCAGGTSDLDNLALAHRACNQRKSYDDARRALANRP